MRSTIITEGFTIGLIYLLYFHLCYTLELHMFCVQLYLLCTLYVCVVSLTYYEIKYHLQYILFSLKLFILWILLIIIVKIS